MAEEKQFLERLSPTTIYGFDGGGLDSYMVIDAAIQDGHDVSVEITSHPIEFGANISDHAIIQPRVYTLRGRIATISTRGGNAVLDVIGDALNRPQVAWEKLQDLAFARSIVTVETVLKTYDNVVLESLHTDQDWQTARVLDFDATFREVFVVAAPRIDIPIGSPTSEEEPATPSLSVAEQADIEKNIGETVLFDQQTWATDDQFFDQTNIPDLRNVNQ